MRLGVDFGTTNSAAGLYDGERFLPIITDPDNQPPSLLPSLLYIDREHQSVVGSRAAELYLETETGRPVRWVRRDSREIETTVASLSGDPIEFLQTTSVMVDEGARGRLLQSIKTVLGNPRYEGTEIFERFYPVDVLIARILSTLKQAAETHTRRNFNEVTLGRPVHFSRNPVADSRAESILLRAAYLAGFQDVVFQLEPVAVAHYFHRTSRQRQTVLVFDFGGGTLDLTLARVGGTSEPEILATRGVRLGGDDLDRRIMATLLPYFGGGDEGILPPDIVERLLSWQAMPELSQPHYRSRIRELRRIGKRNALDALETLVTKNLGFKLFKEIERVKKQLSQRPSVALTFEYEAVQIHHSLTRRRFERLIAPDLALVESAIRELVPQPETVDLVLRTGGSSLIPAFQGLLIDIFGEDRQQAIEPMNSVVGGMAVSAYEVSQQPQQMESIIDNVQSASGRPCYIQRSRVGSLCYTDRNFTIHRLPYQLDRRPYIQTSNLDHTLNGTHALQFTLRGPARVYIASQIEPAELPEWMQPFTPEPMQVEIIDDFALIRRSLRVYSREYPPGQVVLGGNRGVGIVNYMVFVGAS